MYIFGGATALKVQDKDFDFVLSMKDFKIIVCELNSKIHISKRSMKVTGVLHLEEGRDMGKKVHYMHYRYF